MSNLARIAAVVALALAVGSACGAPAGSAPTPSTGPESAAATPAAAQPPMIGGCPLLPVDNIWNTPVDTLPIHPSSAAYVSSIGANSSFHPDFGADPSYGIPYQIVDADQPGVEVIFDYDDESDPGPYPIPDAPKIEAGGDRHILIVQQGACKLYELFAAREEGGRWYAGSGAIFDLRSNALRPDTWTSADAAGLPILPGLVRRDEVEAGAIEHALRFTASRTREAHVWPARHDASSITDPGVPPMGQRFRLKAGFDISRFPEYDRVILRALKKYGMILADNGSNWYVSGANDTGWDDEALNLLKQLKGSDFEAVDTSSLMVDPNSGRVNRDGKGVTPPSARESQPATFTIAFAGAGAAMTSHM